MAPHTLYGIGIIWSPTWMYGSPHMYNMMSMTLMVPHTLYGTGIVYSTHMYVWSPSMYDLMLPLTLYGTGIVWSPHMYDVFSVQLQKRSTACPKHTDVQLNYRDMISGKQQESQ